VAFGIPDYAYWLVWAAVFLVPLLLGLAKQSLWSVLAISLGATTVLTLIWTTSSIITFIVSFLTIGVAPTVIFIVDFVLTGFVSMVMYSIGRAVKALKAP
jgi:hypothetical protein